MTLDDLGYTDALERFRTEQGLEGYTVGRVVAEHRERYVVRTIDGDVEAEIIGKLRAEARDRMDFPAVGDWVALRVHEPGHATIHRVFPRSSAITRKAIGEYGGTQIIATNIDHAFLVQAMDRDFNINRLERYLTICHASGVRPIIVLTKTDLFGAEQVDELKEQVRARIAQVPIIALSNVTQDGCDAVRQIMEKGKTYCLLGSSGVGKSSLLNNLLGTETLRTGTISDSTGKGRHITSHRELFVLGTGGIIIDNPGMREVGVTDVEGGLELTFDRIAALAQDCKFSDCTHTTEIGCAVLAALQRGEVDEASYANYEKMKNEAAFFRSTLAERRKKDKEFGKMVKRYKKDLGKM
ncbi:MAG TPA: ribosome small subunit-dependent GTPase A [Flavobacteriales bacterium]|nr:ribosome small subunit-dependent GTPase A [Flavobacteriales bacterium]